MKSAVFHAPVTITCDTVDNPTIENKSDIILKLTSTAVCGIDLQIYSGRMPQLKPMVMGHEFMG